MAKKDKKATEVEKVTKKPKKEKVKKEKVKKVKNIKKHGTVVFVENEDQAQQVLKEVMEAPVQKQEKKTSKFWSEFKSFIFIVLIIGGVVGIGFLVQKYVKPLESKKTNSDEGTKVVEGNDYKTVVYNAGENRYLSVIEDQYVIEYEADTLYKVFDMDGNVLFEGKEGYTDILLGIDDELYLTMASGSQTDSSIGIYKISNKELVEVFKAEDEGFIFTTLIYNDNKKNRLVGVVGENYDYGESDTSKSLLYTLDAEKKEISEVRLTGDAARVSVEQPIYTYNKNYVVVKDTNSDFKYGVYDIKNDEIIVNTKYEGLYTTRSGNYIAVKNKKAGLINIKSKILVDFKYDFISDENGFYVTSIDKKLGIINNEFKEVIKPTFTYQQVENAGFSYQLCCGAMNSFKAIKYNDKYILSVNEGEIYSQLNYKVHETYVIDSKGEYLTIGANEFGISGNFIYGYDKDVKKYTVYDENFAEKYIIDISKYDFEDGPYISLVNDNTIVVSLDTDLYYDYATGEEIESLKDAKFIVDKIEFDYDALNKEVSLKVNGEKISTYDYRIGDNNGKFYNNVKDKLYYYITDNMYVMVRKSE